MVRLNASSAPTIAAARVLIAISGRQNWLLVSGSGSGWLLISGRHVLLLISGGLLLFDIQWAVAVDIQWAAVADSQ